MDDDEPRLRFPVPCYRCGNFHELHSTTFCSRCGKGFCEHCYDEDKLGRFVCERCKGIERRRPEPDDGWEK